MSDLNLDVDFVFNTPEALAEANRIENGIKHIGLSAEEAAKKLLKSFDPAVGILQQVQNEVLDLKKALKDATDGVEIGNIKKKLEELKSFEATLTSSAAKAKSNFNGLQNSINQISRELPAFTYSAQTGFMAIANNIPMAADEIKKLIKLNAELAANGQKVTPVWRQIASGLLSWNTLLSVGITLMTVYGKEIGNFLIALFKGKEAIDAAKESIKTLNAAFASTDYKKAVMNVNELTLNIDLAKKGLIDKSDVLDHYNKTIGNTTGQVKTLDEAEIALAKNATAYVNMTLYKAAANLALEEAAKKSYEAEISRRKKLEEFGNEFLDASVTNVRSKEQYDSQQANIKANRERRKQEEIKASEDAKNVQLNIAKDFQKQAAEISSKNKFDFYGDAGSDAKAGESAAAKLQRELEAALSLRKGVLEKIAKLDAEYARKSFDKDAEELQALRDKFAEMRKIIIEENEKLAKYNKTHKNQLPLIAVTSVDGIEKSAVENLTYRQQTEHYKVTIDEQKKLYADFEAFKLTFGEAKAKERFAGQLDLEHSYLDKLRTDYAITLAQGYASGFDGKIQARLSLQGKAIKAETQAEQKKNDDILKDFQTYATKRIDIQEKYLKLADGLRNKLKNAEADEAVNKGVEELNALDKTNIEKWASYKKLFDGISKLTRAQTLATIAELEKELKAANITTQARAEALKKVNALKTSLKNDGIKDLDGVVSQFANVASEFQDINSSIGNITNALVTSARAYVDIKKNANVLGDSNASTMEKVGAGLGMVSTVLSLGKALNELFNKGARERAEQAKYSDDLQMKQTEALTKALDRQLALINEVYGTEKLTKYADAIKEIGSITNTVSSQLSGMFKLTGDKEMDEIIAKLNRGEQVIAGFTNEQFVKKNQAYYDALKIPINDLKELQRLLDTGKLDAKTSQLVQTLIDLKQKAIEAANAIKAELVGTSFETFADGIVDLFATVDASTEDWSNNFTKMVQQTFLRSFKTKEFTAELQKFYDQYTEFAKGGLTAAEVDELRNRYNKIIADGKAEFDQLASVAGVSFKDAATSSKNGLTGAYSTASQESISVLSGHTAGMRLAQLEGNQIQKNVLQTGSDQLSAIRAMHITQMEIALYTKRTADASDTFLPLLKNIADNTRDSLASQLRANGNYKN